MDSSRTSLLRDRSVYRSSEGEVAEMSTPQTYVPRHLVYNGRRPMTKENGYRNRGGITTKSAYSKGLQPNRETQDDTGGRFTHYIEAHRIETVYTAGSSSPDFRRHLESKAKGDHGGKDVEKEAEEVAPEQATKDKVRIPEYDTLIESALMGQMRTVKRPWTAGEREGYVEHTAGLYARLLKKLEGRRRSIIMS
ncbi:uncharacterized protein DFL_007733 [Arthrobotrys flagrans]|uniref:Uncharacterized protein n=1 Tax=Arthrobotrys flagrans TaxID=97331 RepID=A0A436ZWH9_ARTFL|nr:hypothetical protein DFL_007733 [Arthrobotrys flagrans]